MLETIHWQNLLVLDFFFWYKKIGNFYLLIETYNLYLLWICWDVWFLSAIIWIVCAFLEICSFKFPIDNVKLSVRFPMALTSRRYQPCFNSDFYAPFHLVGFKLIKRSLRDVAHSQLCEPFLLLLLDDRAWAHWSTYSLYTGLRVGMLWLT